MPAQLIVTELASNAVEHGRAPVELRVTVRHQVLRIEVSDQSPAMIDELAARRTGTGRYGLRLVDALAGNWGAVPTRHGKTIWAELLLATRRHTATQIPRTD